MLLNLERPICFFDLETTGTNIVKDRIVEIGIIKIFPDGKQNEKIWRVNPECPIPNEATLIHGITDLDVKNEPSFKDLSNNIYNFIKNSDLAGYNSDRFDIPLLVEEMLRADVNFNFDDVKTIDVQTIFHKMEQRNLSAALKFYCDKEHKDAHSALADTRATYEVLNGQLKKYSELNRDVNFLSEFSTNSKFADFAGFIVYDKDGEESFSFGKHKGQKVKIIMQKEPGYFGWIMNADFPIYTKKVLTAIRLKNSNI